MSTEGIVRELSNVVESRPADPPPQAVHLPPRDGDDAGGDHIGDAEGQSFMIDYTDAAGKPSRRRITVWHIEQGSGGIPCLYARCHERAAMRNFRVDRIACCIDYDGVVHDDVPAFLSETFGMSLGLASARPAAVDSWQPIKNAIWADAVLLAAISRVDAKRHDSETDVATRHLVALAERAGQMLTESDITAVWRYVARLRPTYPAIARAIVQISERGPDHIKRALLACVQVMDADGRRHRAEAVLVNQLARELLGITLFH